MSTAAASTLLCDVIDNVALAQRVMRSRDGKPGGEKHIYISNAAVSPNSNLTFLLGDADKGRYVKVIRKPSTYQDSGQGALTMLLAAEGEDAAALRALQNKVVDGMKEFGLLNASISNHPDVIKLVMSPIILDKADEPTVMIGTNVTDETEYFLKITKGQHAGKFMPIRQEDIRVGDRIVVSLRMDRHRDKPKHRFTRYTQRVFVIERGSYSREAASIVGSSGKAIDVIEFDPSLVQDDYTEPAGAAAEGEAGAAGAAATAAASNPSPAPAAGAPAAAAASGSADQDEDDEFAHALKRARSGGN
jgi:hypothetical protein